VCDPVLGDGGKLYVPAELVDAYRAEVVPLASVVTPNQFEAELLTQRPVRTLDDAVRACAALRCAALCAIRVWLR
jgi:pyridoxine kinase